ncbi:hypothetical protein LPJ63_002643 [Coemansia sp. RSA 2711]|nr:hypothetical protein LPJ63_002643 [Coemansia sp. RSA 2711]KAJ2312029.1 hypothetical protein IWW54_002322 [Coemansia sp. RSA 2705]KAJ2319378.1 hypothetical protein IWW52_002004 [Coemansia sp. RSA 2704]KAJ2366651.1 hypothetical protein H4S01_002587 [Coemansia sp. RSA 2610]KAJ2737255.1 hypothetical protein H4R23_001874 [Coemansia sp. Cherry 401B]
MTRGNQRELARQRNQKKQQQEKGKAKGGVSHTKQKEIDAEIMRQKQLKKAEKAEGAK